MGYQTSYERLAVGLTIPAGKSTYGFRIELPFTGYIKKLVVVQTSGPSVGFTVNLYNARAVETAQGPATFGLPIILASVIPSISATAGNPATLFDPNNGYVYRNLENTSQSPSVVDRALYLAISHASQAQPTVWAAAIGLQTDI